MAAGGRGTQILSVGGSVPYKEHCGLSFKQMIDGPRAGNDFAR